MAPVSSSQFTLTTSHTIKRLLKKYTAMLPELFFYHANNRATSPVISGCVIIYFFNIRYPINLKFSVWLPIHVLIMIHTIHAKKEIFVTLRLISLFTSRVLKRIVGSNSLTSPWAKLYPNLDHMQAYLHSYGNKKALLLLVYVSYVYKWVQRKGFSLTSKSFRVDWKCEDIEVSFGIN